MDSKDILDNEKEELNQINSKNTLKKLKSDYFLQKVFNVITKKISLEIIKYNKNIKKRININTNDYKEYSEKYSSIELEIIPMKGGYRRFIYIKEEDKNYYHIYFNDNKGEKLKELF